MRIILSEGQVNIFNLAKKAGTSWKRSLSCVDGAQPKLNRPGFYLLVSDHEATQRRVVLHENLLSLSGIETKRSN